MPEVYMLRVGVSLVKVYGRVAGKSVILVCKRLKKGNRCNLRL